MASTPNPEQQRAIGHAAGSLVLSAGAGTGKTSVLVQRYLKHLQDGVAVSQLAAITFTEKAAREMRKRIRDAVRAIIAKQEPGSEGFRQWRLIETHLETAAIDTIHGYCTSLLRKHHQAANLAADFSVLDDALGAMLRKEAVTESLQSLLLEDSPTGEDLRELIVLHGWQRIVGAVEGFLDDPDVAAWREFAAKLPGQIAAEWSAVAKAFVPKMAAASIDGSAAIAALRRIEPTSKEGTQTLQDVLAELDRFRADPFAVDVAALCEAAKVGNHHSAKKLYGADNYPIVRDGYKAIRETLSDGGLSELAEVPENLESAAEVSLRMVRVALNVEAAYAARKREVSALDFHDLLVRARDLLQQNHDLRQAIQEQIRYLLLDELQDTDPVQMQLVELLLGERFRGGGLFAVGDAKQSIYRFRGAEVALFEKLRESVPPESRLQLAKNYRSRPGVIRFVNALCREWFPDEAALEATRDESTSPAVEFLWAQSESEKPIAEDLRHGEAAAIATRIQEIIAAGRQPGDIVLLFRALSNASIYEEALRKLKIDYYLVGGRAFFAQQEVYDLVNLLGAIENPFDGLALVGTLRSPFCGLSDDAITAICQHKDGPWPGLLAESNLVPAAERESVRRAGRFLAAWRQIKDSIPIARLLQRIFADCGYDAALLYEPLGQRKLANLWKLHDLARNFDRSGRGIAEFAIYLSELVVRQPREEQAATLPEEAGHVVRLMSIHQAKGLEFPVVFVPDLGAKVREGHSAAAYWHRSLAALVTVPGDSDESEVGYPQWPCKLGQKLERLADDLESLRVLYVACTRAEELLILSSGVKGAVPIEPAGPWMEALARVFDLTTGEGAEKVIVKIV